MNFVLSILTIFLIFIFGLTGVGKVIGLQKFKENFIHLHLPQWFRFITGMIEIIAAINLIIGFWEKTYTIIGSFLLIGISIGGSTAHIRMKHDKKDIYLIVILGLIATFIFIMNF